MAYTPNPTWEDSPSTDTPIEAARLNHLENGVVAAASAADSAASAAAVASGEASAAQGTANAAQSTADTNTAAIAALGTAAHVNTGTTSGTVPLLGTGGVLAIGRLATGTPDGTKFVRDDGTLAVPPGGGGGSGTAAGTSFAPAGTAWVSTDLQNLGQEIDTTITARVMQGVIDARSGMSLGPIYIRATADTSATVSDATLNNDPTLAFTAIPVGEYDLRGFIAYDSATAAEFMMGFTHTGTMTLDWSANGLAPTAASDTGSITRDLLAIGDTVTVGANGVGNTVTASPTGMLIVTVAGNLQFQWCQGVSTASNTIRRARSFLSLNKVA